MSWNSLCPADSAAAVFVAGVIAWIISGEAISLFKQWIIVELVSRLYLLDERINKEVDASFNSAYSLIPIRKLICLAIILQKKLCHALLLHALSTESAWEFIDPSFWHERTQLITVLCNGFAAHYFAHGFLDGKFWIPCLVPVFCLAANAALFMRGEFVSMFLWPSIGLALLFLFCYSLIVHFFHAAYIFKTAILSNCADHAEKVGSLHLAKQVIYSMYAPFSALSLAGPCLTILCLNFTVGAAHYPEQYLLRKLAQLYSQTDCSICLDSLNGKPVGDVTLTDCFHFFHAECLHSWTKQKKQMTCPLCRKAIEYEDEIDNLEQEQQELEQNQIQQLVNMHQEEQEVMQVQQQFI